MNERKALATIETEIGTMTIYFNGIGEEMTAEQGDYVEEIGYTPNSYEGAADTVYMMYGSGPWFLEWLE